MKRPLKGLSVLALALVAAAGLSACRESEMGRPISLEKGNYQGPRSQPLSQATLKALRERTAGQSYSGN